MLRACFLTLPCSATFSGACMAYNDGNTTSTKATMAYVTTSFFAASSEGGLWE